jgi:hypothetical protein
MLLFGPASGSGIGFYRELKQPEVACLRLVSYTPRLDSGCRRSRGKLSSPVFMTANPTMTALVESISRQRQRVRVLLMFLTTGRCGKWKGRGFTQRMHTSATERPSLLFLEGEKTAKAVHQHQITLHLA